MGTTPETSRPVWPLSLSLPWPRRPGPSSSSRGMPPYYDEYTLKEFPVTSRYLITVWFCIHSVISVGDVFAIGDDAIMKALMALGLLRPIFMVLCTYTASIPTVIPGA